MRRNDQLANRRERADPKSAEWLYAAERQTLRMITEGASLTDILTHVCTTIDRQISPSITTILLMDPDGRKLWPTAGPKVPSEWMRAISPLPVAPHVGLCGTAASTKTRVIVAGRGHRAGLVCLSRAGPETLYTRRLVAADCDQRQCGTRTFAVYLPRAAYRPMPMLL